MDKWLLSRLNTTVRLVDEHLGGYRIPEAAKALESFVDEMSNWYVRRSRERYWKEGMEQDKINAYMTLYTALVTIAKISSPMIPFMCEDIYQNLVRTVDKNAPESVHLCSFPEADMSLVDEELEKNMEAVLDIVQNGRAARNGAVMKNRQPLAKMFVKSDFVPDEKYFEIIEEELNVKQVEFIDDVASLVSYSFKPQLKTVGPKYGKHLGAIREWLTNIDGSAAKAELDTEGKLTLEHDGETIKLFEEDLLIDVKQKEGYYTFTDKGVTVTLDTTLTPELIEEGMVREIVSKLQTMRKEAGFEVMDHIRVGCVGNENIAKAILNNREEISSDVLALEISCDSLSGYEKEWDINGETVKLSVEKL